MANEKESMRPFVERISEVPIARGDARSVGALGALSERARSDAGLSRLRLTLEQPRALELLAGVFSGSTYLTSLIERDPARLQRILETAPEVRAKELKSELAAQLGMATTRAEAMRALRVYKAEVALLTALADLGGVWPVLSVTQALSECADAALTGAVEFLFREA
ncbi:MAG: bifunctional [glutamine synthetase] adenylyltransferase/[glutamine synthetase]-adenylyl-L-tyrosine phosphorylase, partial [Hyphomicrobium sp.]